MSKDDLNNGRPCDHIEPSLERVDGIGFLRALDAGTRGTP